MNLLLYNSAVTTNPLHTIIPLTQYFHFTCYISVPFIFTKNNGNKSVSVIDTWLSIRDTICLAQRSQRTRSCFFCHRDRYMSVHTRCHLSRTEGTEDAEPPNVIAWRHRRSGMLSTSFRQPRRFHATVARATGME
jgi:hypothetical protein